MKTEQARRGGAGRPAEGRGGTIVFADGASKGNPGPGGWAAIIVTEDKRVVELGGGSPHTTNNQMELSAVINALQYLRGTPGKVALYCDSKYVIHGITEWIHGWRSRGWKTAEGEDVLNRSYWERLWRLVEERSKPPCWHYVPGHSGVAGNERADEICNAFATSAPVKLYKGTLEGYPVSIFPLPAEPPPAARSRRSRTLRNAKPYSYLSLVGGKVMRHTSWEDCERRVRGVSGARFKKAMSAEEEEEILRAWKAKGRFFSE